MKKLYFSVLAFAIILLFALVASAQSSERGYEIGLGVGGAAGLTEVDEMPINPLARVYITGPLFSHFRGDFGVGFGIIGGDEYETNLAPIALRLRFYPTESGSFLPYLYFGGGVLFYDVQTVPPNWSANEADLTDSTPLLLAGLGFDFRLSESITFDLNGGLGYSFSDDLNPIIVKDDDSYLGALAGLTFSVGGGDPDPDGDGLMTKEEKKIGTDPKNYDTDGDGLSDGSEVNIYKTNPLKADSDGEGLNDKAEIQVHGTNPNMADSDGDGLDDAAEIVDYKTNPLEVDTDEDNLSDYDEVMTHKTDPLMADTDGDGLPDNDELSFNSNPLVVDTDGGGLNDFDEYLKEKDPQNPEDDVEKEVLKTEVGVPIVLDGIKFAINSAKIEPESETILMRALNTLEAYPDMTVEINGYTDITGSREYNMMLSQKRADSVKAWLIDHGIEGERLVARGLGPDNPIAPNTTREGRQKNRRIEFVRVK